MDLTKTGLYNDLLQCEGEGRDEAFDAIVRANIRPEVMLRLHSHYDIVSDVKVKIAAYAKAGQQRHCDNLYQALEKLTDRQLSSIISEVGSKVIGKCISHFTEVKMGDNEVLNELKAKHGRSVVILPHGPYRFKNPVKVKAIDRTPFIVPESWSRVEIIECKTDHIVLPCLFPKLTTIKTKRNVRTDFVQPSVKKIKADKVDLDYFPNVEVLLVSNLEVQRPMPSVLLSRVWKKDTFPNLKVLTHDDAAYRRRHGECTQEGLIIKDGKFVEAKEGDLFIRHHAVTIESRKRFYGCQVIITRTIEEPLEFYCCKFFDFYMNRLHDEQEIRHYLPNAIILG